METKKEIKELEKNLKENVSYKPIKSPIKRLNYFWKDKQGNKLTYSEFMKRFKQGMEGVTPLQQTKIQLKSTFIMIIGILAGIFITIIGIKTLWWLMIILIGALFNTGVQWLGLWQKKILFERMEVMQNGK